MITILGLLAALVALLTGSAMLKDTYLTRADRADLRAILRHAFATFRRGGLSAVDRAELSVAVRFALRIGVLILIVASSGVAILEGIAGPQPGLYDVLLRCGLAAFMAMQAPCPWIRWITVGDRRTKPQKLDGGRPNVH